MLNKQIIVAGRTKVCTLFCPSNTGIMGSNPTRGMECVCIFLCFYVWVEVL
jgi:hypothetical protein